METIIKNKKQQSIMKKILIFLIMVLCVAIPSFATHQEQLLRYSFETGSGSIVIDQTGNNNNGLITGATYDSTGSRFGTFGMNFDGVNDWVDSIGSFLTPNQYYISFWVKPDANMGTKVLYQINNNAGTEHFHLYYDFTNNLVLFGYYNLTGVHNIITLENYTLPRNGVTWTHFVVGVDSTDNTTHYWRNGNFIGEFNLIGGYSKANTSNVARIGAALDGSGDYDGDIDEFRIFNFEPLDSQVVELFTLNTITLQQDNVTNVTTEENEPLNGTQEFDIISSYSPSNGSDVDSVFSISATLNTLASCDLYIDNEFIISNNNVLAFTNQISDLSVGEHDYFLYCYVVDSNNILNYEFTNVTTINVNPSPPSTIQLVFQSSSVNIASTPLFAITPCLKKSIAVPLVPGSPYKMINNQGGVYFAPLINGVATFNLSAGEHDFCLMHGVGQFNNPNGFSDEWYINQAEHQEILGKFAVPSNVTQTFIFNIDESDLYDITNPKWWNTTWVEIIGSLLAFLIGVVILFVGIEAKDGKILLVGAFLILASLGYQMSNILVGVLF